MPVFTYRVRDRQGQLVAGTLEADNQRGVIDSLDRAGYSVVEISLQREIKLSLASLFERFERLEKREVILFTRQLSTLLRTGTSLSPSLSTICEQTTNKKFKAILEDVRHSVQSGMSFSQSLSRHPKVFSDLFISMVEVGEAGGMLDDVLERLAILGAQEQEVYSRITSALVYPVVLVFVAFIVVSFLIIGVLPKFVMVFQASGIKLPLPTQVILGISWILRKFWLVISIAIGLGLLWFKNYTRREEGRFIFHSWLLKIPIFGKIYSKIQVSRFSRLLSTLIASGIPILEALIVVEKTITNAVIRRAIQNIRVAISEGSSLVDPFKKSGLFSPMIIQMVSTGEKTGKLDQMLTEIATYYDPEIEYSIKNLTALLEPVMLLTMGIMVAFIALSVLLPIFNLIKAFRG